MFECNLGGYAHWGGWFTAVAFLLAGSFIAWLILHFGKPKKPLNADRIDSMEILKLRLAKGEITLEEYTILKSTL